MIYFHTTHKTSQHISPITSPFYAQSGLPANTAVERVSESVETASFKSLFSVWAPAVDFNFNKFNKDAVKKGDEIIDIQKLLALKAVESTPVDDGSGT